MLNWRQRIIVILCAILLGMGLGYLQIKTQHHKTETTTPATSSDSPVTSTPNPLAGVKLGGDFLLFDQDGQPATQKSWPGQFRLYFFGFAHCPDVCPLGLAKIAETLNLLPKDMAAKIQPIFVTLDPARDRPELLKDYVAIFHPRLVGLTGTQEQVDVMINNFRVYAQKQPVQGDPNNYMINHSAYTYLANPVNEVIDVFAHEASPQEMADKIKAHIPQS
jgi:cytochrome oxidase Cu insertion factor (SCO1/SenC/PrrC family)